MMDERGFKTEILRYKLQVWRSFIKADGDSLKMLLSCMYGKCRIQCFGSQDISASAATILKCFSFYSVSCESPNSKEVQY